MLSLERLDRFAVVLVGLRWKRGEARQRVSLRLARRGRKEDPNLLHSAAEHRGLAIGSKVRILLLLQRLDKLLYERGDKKARSKQTKDSQRVASERELAQGAVDGPRSAVGAQRGRRRPLCAGHLPVQDSDRGTPSLLVPALGLCCLRVDPAGQPALSQDATAEPQLLLLRMGRSSLLER